MQTAGRRFIPGEPENDAAGDEDGSAQPGNHGRARVQAQAEQGAYDGGRENETDPKERFDECFGDHPEAQFHEVTTLSPDTVNAHCPAGGCKSSTLLPSGSMTQPNFPYSDSSVFSRTLQPSSRSA